MGKKKRVTKEELIERALDELKRHERPIHVTVTPGMLSIIDDENRAARRRVLEKFMINILATLDERT